MKIDFHENFCKCSKSKQSSPNKLMFCYIVTNKNRLWKRSSRTFCQIKRNEEKTTLDVMSFIIPEMFQKFPNRRKNTLEQYFLSKYYNKM